MKRPLQTLRPPRRTSRPGTFRLVANPGVRPSARRELPFPAALAWSCVAAALLALAGSRWVLPGLVVAPEVVETPLEVVDEGELLEEAGKLALFKPVRPEAPALMPAPRPPRSLPKAVMPETPAPLPAPPVPDPLAMEELLAQAMAPFPPPVIEKKAPSQKVQAALKVTRKPKQSSRPRTASTSRTSSVKRSARLVKRVTPTYPLSARRAGTEGRVIVLVTVAANGRVSHATVTQSSGSKALDRAALSAVRRWTFQPATVGGKAVSSQVRAPVTFRLD